MSSVKQGISSNNIWKLVLYACQHAQNFVFSSYTVVCIGSFYSTDVGRKQPILIYLSENI